MGQGFKELNETPDLSQWKINRQGLRRYQTKQSKLKPTEYLSATSYCGWVTTEDIFKSGLSRTTIGKLARLNHESQSTIQHKELKIRLGALSTAISRSQIKHKFHHDEKITNYNSFYDNESESTGIFADHEYYQRQREISKTADSSILTQDTLLVNPNTKHDRMDFGKSYVNKVELKESIGMPTLTQPSSKLRISYPTFGNEIVHVDTVVSKYLSGDGAKIRSCGFREENQLNIDNDVLQEKNVSPKSYEGSFNPEYPCFEEFDQGIDDVDFLTAGSGIFTPSDELLSVEKENYSKLTQPPSLSAVSGENLSVTYQTESKVNTCSIDRKILSHPASKHDNTLEKPVGMNLPKSLLLEYQTSPNNFIAKETSYNISNLEKGVEESFLQFKKPKKSKLQANLRGCVGLDHSTRTRSQQNKLKTVSSPISNYILNNQNSQLFTRLEASVLDDGYESHDPGTFSRIEFPQLVNNDSPIIGLSSDNCLRTCFHIEEMINEAQKFMTLNTAPVIELFARVLHSYREPNSTRQKFLFSDIWLDNSSFLNGILMNYKATKLIDEESQTFIGNDSKRLLARILATLKRRGEMGIMDCNIDNKIISSSWLLHIISIRKTDFEEINWTRRIVNAY